ncbi:MAG: hypothetical protein KC609_08480 [Myxococcales bacterium]|nr:hypothetical protein [Myxococcales bacterium]
MANGKCWLALTIVCIALATQACGGSSATSDAGVQGDMSTGSDSTTLDASDLGAGDLTSSDIGNPTSSALLRPECGPADGPAARLILLMESEQQCGDTMYSGYHLSLYFDLPITAPMTLQLADIWSVDLCQSTGLPVPCETATSGSITFTSFESGVGATGSFSFTFGSGTRSGTFDATWCALDHPLLCG